MAKTKAIQLDYPQLGETVVSPQYTFRIGAEGAPAVEISINDGPWQPCRESVGFWWYDWRPDASGPCTAVARRADGIPAQTAPRRFQVALVGAPAAAPTKASRPRKAPAKKKKA